MPKFALVGPTYTSQSKAADGERSVNLYPEVIESGHGKDGATVYLVGTPGYQLLVQLPTSPLRCLYSGDGKRLFAVAGDTLYEITAITPPPTRLGFAELRNLIILASGGTTGPVQTATMTAAQWVAYYVTVTGENAFLSYGFGPGRVYALGALVTIDEWLPLAFSTASYNNLGLIPGADGVATTRAQILANGTQLMVIAGQNAYVNEGPPGLTQVIPAVMGCYVDGYGILLDPGGQLFYITNLFDFSTVSPLDYGGAQGEPSAIIGMIADHREAWLFKQRSVEVFDDTGAAYFPFQRNPAGFIEQGIGAAASACSLDNTVFWLGGDMRGIGIAWRAVGYNPFRVSNHAVEQQWAKYPRMDDAEGFGWQYQGHSYYVLHFPSANPTVWGGASGATWVYDCASSTKLGTAQWHEAAYWDPIHASWMMHRGRVHAFCRNQHVIGDWLSGKVYVTDAMYRTQDNNPLRWLRSSPVISEEMKVLYFGALLIDMQVGTGLNDDIAVVNTQTAPETAIGINDSIAQMNADVAAGPQPVTLGQAGKNPSIQLRLSRDGGNTWGNSRSVSTGKMGDYLYRARANRNGRARNLAVEVSGSDPTPVALLNGDFESITVGNGS